MNKLKRILLSLSVTLGFAAPALMPAMASAQDINQNLCNGADFNFSAENSECDPEADGSAASTVDSIIVQVINIISVLVGVVSVIMIIYGGFRYITSGGESGSVTSAKNTILYAIVGLVIVALAQVIVRFVIGSVNSATSDA